MIIRFSEEENKKIGMIKAIFNLNSKEAAVQHMIRKYDLKLDENPQTPLQ
jgi:hypothetical protein